MHNFSTKIGVTAIFALALCAFSISQASAEVVEVNCGDGDSIQEAVDSVSPGDPTTIFITGVCTENIVITTDDVTLRNEPPGRDEIIAQDPGQSAILIDGARRVSLKKLILTGGDQVLRATGGASFSASKVTITGAGFFGLVVEDTATGTLTNSTVNHTGEQSIKVLSNGSLKVSGGLIENSGGSGVLASSGGHVELTGGAVVRATGGTGGHAGRGGSIEVNDAIIEKSGVVGMSVNVGGSLTVDGPNTFVRNNNDGGLIAGLGGSLAVIGGAHVIKNNAGGIGGFVGAHIVIQDGAIVEENTGDGVTLAGGSTANIQGSFIRKNIGNGVHLRDTSVGIFDATNKISGNTGFGIICDPPPAVAQIEIGDVATVSGNTAGQIDCPIL